MVVHNFRELIAWQKSMALAKYIYTVSSHFPQSEQYALTSQVQRAATSIPSNIAEGAGRTTQKELVHFLSFALGSSYELETEISLAKEFVYIDNETYTDLNNEIVEVQKLIYSLMKKYNDSH